MNWTLILALTALVFGAVATVLQSKEKKRVALYFTLAVAVISGVSFFVQKRDYSTEVPAVSATQTGKVINIIIVNVDNKLPLKDVSVKLDGVSTIDVNTLNPSQVRFLQQVEVPQKSTTWVLVVWYNGTESIEVDLNITVNPDSTTKIEYKYFDKKGVEFVPDWKKRSANSTDTTTRHYNPQLFR